MANISSTDSNTIPAMLASLTRRGYPGCHQTCCRIAAGRALPRAAVPALARRAPGCQNHSPREMRRAMFNAFGNAKLAGRDEFKEDDIAESRGKQRRRIGF